MLAAVLTLLLVSPQAVAQTQPQFIEGTARFGPDGRPAVGLSISTPGAAWPRHVEIDAQGHFRLEAQRFLEIDRTNGKEEHCWVLAEPEGRWRIEAMPDRPRGDHREAMRWLEALQLLSRSVQGVWRDGRLMVDCPEPGEVDVLVVGTDGQPLPDQPVVVVHNKGSIRSGIHVLGVRFHGRTDTAGRFRLRWFEGTRHLEVTVPGVGTAKTPPFDVAAGRTVSVATPPLVRSGSISGRFAPALVTPGASMMVGLGDTRHWSCDAEGRFTVPDLPPGRYQVEATGVKSGTQAARLTVWLAPGAKVEGLVIDAVPPPTPEQTERQMKIFSGPAKPADIKAGDELKVEGTVRDIAGRPVSGADVFVRITFHAFTLHQEVAQTVTDAEGRYAVRNQARPMTSTVDVVARAPDGPPSVVHCDGETIRQGRLIRQDLTLADSGGSVRVALRRDGEPSADSRVRLQATGAANLRSGAGWTQIPVSPTTRALDDLLSPVAQTDRDGVASFANLLPGLYSIASINPTLGVAAVAGRETRATRTVNSVDKTVRFRVVGPSGHPIRNRTVGLQVIQGKSHYRAVQIKLDENGIGGSEFDQPGVWTVRTRFREQPRNEHPMDEWPFDEAEAQVTISPALELAEPITLVAIHRPRQTGSLRVRLLDPDGRPARGVVEFDGETAEVDDRGETRLVGLGLDKPQAGDRTHSPRWISAVIDGPGPPAWSTAGPIPPDEVLRGPFPIVPQAEVSITSTQERAVTLAARSMGYLRGQLRPAEGRTFRDYSVYPIQYPSGTEPDCRLDPATGKFLAGPLPVGPVTLRMTVRSPEDRIVDCGQPVVEVLAGAVSHVDLVPRAVRPDDPPLDRSGGGDLGLPRTLPLRVVLPDGRTPAYAAQALLFVPRYLHPVSNGISDASGRLTWQGAGPLSARPDEPKDGRVPGPTLVVSLPGRHGATIVPLQEQGEQRVVLPPEITAEGAVQLGGPPSPRGLRSIVRVVAAHQGGGDLDAALSLTTTADADGRFTLAGLTPGRYLVQAVRDDVWSSNAVEVLAEPGRPLPPIRLEIPAPGEAVTLELRDRDGKPLADETFSIVEPPGPMVDRDATPLRSDRNGHLTLRGLTAGPHAIAYTDGSDVASFSVAPATSSPAPAHVRRVVLRHARP